MRATGPLRCILATATALTIVGCGVGAPDLSSSGTLQIRGTVMGGRQPITGAHLYLYTPGTAGNGSQASTIFVSGVTSVITSDPGGNFNLGGDYTCANADEQAYMVVVGGNPGLAPGVNNTSLVEVSALGRCGDLATTAYVEINELTTVAAAWALAPFTASYDHIGSSSTNAAGIRNAFANAELIVDVHTGQIIPLAANLTIESGKVWALANSIAGCVNSDGTVGCAPLFTAATVGTNAAPTNTFDAAINIVRNPGNNVAGVFYAGAAIAPYPQTMQTAPNDWTLSVTVTGGSMNTPTALGIDPQGNVWVANYSGGINAFSPQGKPYATGGYGVGTLSESYGLAVTPQGNVWVSIAEQPFHYPTVGSVVRFAGTQTGNVGAIQSGPDGDYTVDFPYGISADTDGTVFTANYANASSSHILLNHSVVGGYGTNHAAFPVAVAADAAHGVWLANDSGATVTHVAADRTFLAAPSCCAKANGIALDAGGNAWVSNFSTASVSEVSAAGTTTIMQKTGGGLSGPAGIVVDGAQDIWVSNYSGGTFSKLAGNSNTAAAGTPLSPTGGFGKDASLSFPFGIGVDFSGDVWLSSYNTNSLVEFIGLGAPTATPVTPTPAAP